MTSGTLGPSSTPVFRGADNEPLIGPNQPPRRQVFQESPFALGVHPRQGTPVLLEGQLALRYFDTFACSGVVRRLLVDRLGQRVLESRPVDLAIIADRPGDREACAHRVVEVVVAEPRLTPEGQQPWPPTQSLASTTLSSLTFNAHMCDMILVSGGTPCFLTTENTFFLMRPAIS